MDLHGQDWGMTRETALCRGVAEQPQDIILRTSLVGRRRTTLQANSLIRTGKIKHVGKSLCRHNWGGTGVLPAALFRVLPLIDQVFEPPVEPPHRWNNFGELASVL